MAGASEHHLAGEIYVCASETSPIVVPVIMHVGCRSKKCSVGVLQCSRVRQSKEDRMFGLNQRAADMRHGGALKISQVLLTKENLKGLNDIKL